MGPSCVKEEVGLRQSLHITTEILSGQPPQQMKNKKQHVTQDMLLILTAKTERLNYCLVAPDILLN